MTEYDYPRFLYAVARHRGRKCWLRQLLLTRSQEEMGEWSAMVREKGISVPMDERATDWRRFGDCDGPMDAHHLVSKQRIKRDWPHPLWFPDGDLPTTAAVLMDVRNGVIVCRRHHDLLERRLVVPSRAELPEDAVEFAEEVGMGWSIDRDYPEAA